MELSLGHQPGRVNPVPSDPLHFGRWAIIMECFSLSVWGTLSDKEPSDTAAASVKSSDVKFQTYNLMGFPGLFCFLAWEDGGGIAAERVLPCAKFLRTFQDCGSKDLQP